MNTYILVVCLAHVTGHPHVCSNLYRVRHESQIACERALKQVEEIKNPIFAFCRPAIPPKSR